jgi:CopG family nickel-responsive transcriptional regulator
MERITMTLDSLLAELFDKFVAKRGYINRSEAMRDLIRQYLEKGQSEETIDGYCVATLSYVYNHYEYELARKLSKVHHRHHDLTLSTTHIHLDHDHCLEITIMRGLVKTVKNAANVLMAERGVRHGKLNMIPIDVNEASHTSDGAIYTHKHPFT